jgi:hypothetical protein
MTDKVALYHAACAWSDSAWDFYQATIEEFGYEAFETSVARQDYQASEQSERAAYHALEVQS